VTHRAAEPADDICGRACPSVSNHKFVIRTGVT
jgi:hypothetical protein